MKARLIQTILCIVFIILSGCTSKKIYRKDISFPSSSTQNIFIYKQLKKQYEQWQGVKYKYGGTTKKGVDCSAFVQNTYINKLKVSLPRTTALQVKIGKQINKQNLKIGDLIFFRTGKNTRHVGIYLKDGKFMHSSSSRGVHISHINNTYYKKYFWKIKRILN